MERRTRASTMQAQNAVAPVSESSDSAPSGRQHAAPEQTDISVKSETVPESAHATAARKSTKRPSASKRHLTEDARKAIIEKHKAEPLLSQQQIVEWLDKEHGIVVDRTTIGRTIQRHSLREEGGSAQEPSGVDVLELTLFEWYSARTKSTEPTVDNDVDGEQSVTIMAMSLGSFKEKAAELLATGDYEVPEDFALSDRWLQDFLKKYGLEVTAISQDSSTSETPTEMTDKAEWPNDLLPYLAPNKRLEEISVEDAGQEHDVHEEQGYVVPVISASKIITIPGKAVTTPLTAKIGRGRGNNYLTDTTRKALLEKYAECPDWSQTQLADWLRETYNVNVHRATIGRNIKKLTRNGQTTTDCFDESQPEEEELQERKRLKISNHDDDSPLQYLEDALIDYYMEEKTSGKQLPEWKLWRKAGEILTNDGMDSDVKLFTTEWKRDFWSRLKGGGTRNAASKPSLPSSMESESLLSGAVPPSMSDVHNSVNVIRYFVFSSKLDAESKKDLMADLDAIYIRLGEANNVS